MLSRDTTWSVSVETAAQRLKRNVRRLLQQHKTGLPKHRKTITGLAAALDQKPNGISTILSADDVPHFKLRDLDQIAAYFGVTPASLVQAEGDALWEITPTEMRVLRLWREWPREVQDQVLSVLSYFAALAPSEKQSRRFLAKFRRLRRTDQEYVERTMDSLLRHIGGPDIAAPGAP